MMIPRFFFFHILILSAFHYHVSAQRINHLNDVNPFIGTGRSNVPTIWGSSGGTYPGAVAPSGAVQLTPETRGLGERGYEPFFIHFSLTNSGSMGTKIIRLLVDGKPYARKNILLAKGEVEKDSIQCRLYPVGKATLNLEGFSPFVMQVKPLQTYSRFPFRITALTLKPLVIKNGVQQISYAIQNTGGYRHNFLIPLTINDSLFCIDTVALNAGMKKDIEHKLTVRRKGINVVKVCGLMERYRVYDDHLGSVVLDLHSIMDNRTDNVVRDRSGLENNGYIIRSDTGII